jgi:hypothetical protein
MVQLIMKHRGVDFDVEEDPPSFWPPGFQGSTFSD